MSKETFLVYERSFLSISLYTKVQSTTICVASFKTRESGIVNSNGTILPPDIESEND